MVIIRYLFVKNVDMSFQYNVTGVIFKSTMENKVNLIFCVATLVWTAPLALIVKGSKDVSIIIYLATGFYGKVFRTVPKMRNTISF